MLGKIHAEKLRGSIEPVFALSILGYCGNMVDSMKQDPPTGDNTLMKTYL